MDVAGWRQQQEQDTDLQPVLLWVEAQVLSPWEEVTVFSTTTKGLWSKFAAPPLELLVGSVRRDDEDFCCRCDACTARIGPPGCSRAPLQQFPVGDTNGKSGGGCSGSVASLRQW